MALTFHPVKDATELVVYIDGLTRGSIDPNGIFRPWPQRSSNTPQFTPENLIIIAARALFFKSTGR